MVFVDNIAFSLFAISFAGFILLYAIVDVYLAYRKKKKDFSEYLKGASLPLAVIGVYMLSMGLWGQFVWPLPSSYNILFYDPFIAFGMVLLSYSLAVRLGGGIDYAGFLGMMVGVMTIIYGIEGYGIGLTSEPIALLAMYFFFGIAGIFSFPVSLIMERLPGLEKNVWWGWYAVLIIFFVSLFFASALAGLVGTLAIPQHLLKAP
jgi:putative membrane protein